MRHRKHAKAYRVTRKEEESGGGEVAQCCAITGAGEVRLCASALVLFNMCNDMALNVALCSVASGHIFGKNGEKVT